MVAPQLRRNLTAFTALVREIDSDRTSLPHGSRRTKDAATNVMQMTATAESPAIVSFTLRFIAAQVSGGRVCGLDASGNDALLSLNGVSLSHAINSPHTKRTTAAFAAMRIKKSTGES